MRQYISCPQIARKLTIQLERSIVQYSDRVWGTHETEKFDKNVFE
jgi:hypothetical protein